MRFWLLDGIVAYEAGKRLRAIKRLTLAEEYLPDHFPSFPVMPGVLMLEALVQAGSWLVRLSEDFAHSVIVLRQAKGIKYGSFVEPGKCLSLSVELTAPVLPPPSELVWLKAAGDVDGMPTVSARIGLARYNLADRLPGGSELDAELKTVYRRQLALLLQSCGGRESR